MQKVESLNIIYKFLINLSSSILNKIKILIIINYFLININYFYLIIYNNSLREYNHVQLVKYF